MLGVEIREVGGGDMEEAVVAQENHLEDGECVISGELNIILNAKVNSIHIQKSFNLVFYCHTQFEYSNIV